MIDTAFNTHCIIHEITVLMHDDEEEDDEGWGRKTLVQTRAVSSSMLGICARVEKRDVPRRTDGSLKYKASTRQLIQS